MEANMDTDVDVQWNGNPLRIYELYKAHMDTGIHSYKHIYTYVHMNIRSSAARIQQLFERCEIVVWENAKIMKKQKNYENQWFISLKCTHTNACKRPFTHTLTHLKPHERLYVHVVLFALTNNFHWLTIKSTDGEHKND